MNREIPSSTELMSQENVAMHHGLAELKEIEEIISANMLIRGDTVGTTETAEDDEERMAFTHAVVWLLQGKKWLEADENTGKTINDFMDQKELAYSEKIRDEESEGVKKELAEDLLEFQEACDIIRGGMKIREKEKKVST